jgi:hypothetical protein
MMWEIVYMSTLKMGDRFMFKHKHRGIVYSFYRKSAMYYFFNKGWDMYSLKANYDRKVYRLLKP